MNARLIVVGLFLGGFVSYPIHQTIDAGFRIEPSFWLGMFILFCVGGLVRSRYNFNESLSLLVGCLLGACISGQFALGYKSADLNFVGSIPGIILTTSSMFGGMAIASAVSWVIAKPPPDK